MNESLLETMFHRPVLVEEVTALLEPRAGGCYFDGTLGGGGHAAEILRASEPAGRLYATDRDPEAIETARLRLAEFGDRLHCHLAGFDELDRVEDLRGVFFDGALLDLGVSSRQLDAPERGFAFNVEAPLDMRMGGEGRTAAELLNELPVAELAEIFRRYGEEPFAGPIARAVVAARSRRPLATSGQLKEILRSAVPAHFNPVKVYARAFQALRIAVNDELGALAAWLEALPSVLAPGGRAAAISFHSLEDRMVKEKFRALTQACTCPPDLPVCACGATAAFARVTRKPVVASTAEVAANPRARSAKLRAVEKLR